MGQSNSLFSFGVSLLWLVVELDSRGYFDNIYRHQLTIVTDKTFKNQQVELDGNNFSHCKSLNVTFLFNGGTFGFSYNDVDGVFFKSTDKNINQAFLVLAKLGMLKIPAFDENGNVVPPGATWQ
jgi:hypothetical protein